MPRRLIAAVAALVALAALPAAASAGGIVVTLERGHAAPLVGQAWHAHVTVEGCTGFEEFGVDADAPQLVFRHARTGRAVRVTLRENRNVVRPHDYPNRQRYVTSVRLPRAGLWHADLAVTRHLRDAFGFDVRARHPARR